MYQLLRGCPPYDPEDFHPDTRTQIHSEAIFVFFGKTGQGAKFTKGFSYQGVANQWLTAERL